MDLQASSGRGAEILGVNLEGPFLNPSFAGALDARAFLSPSERSYRDITEGFEDIVRIITIAPELDGSLPLIRFLADRGVIVSMGHTNATFSEAEAAHGQGARGITHLFNAMRPYHHREPGAVGFGLLSRDIYVELICDPFSPPPCNTGHGLHDERPVENHNGLRFGERYSSSLLGVCVGLERYRGYASGRGDDCDCCIRKAHRGGLGNGPGHTMHRHQSCRVSRRPVAGKGLLQSEPVAYALHGGKSDTHELVEGNAYLLALPDIIPVHRGGKSLFLHSLGYRFGLHARQLLVGIDHGRRHDKASDRFGRCKGMLEFRFPLLVRDRFVMHHDCIDYRRVHALLFQDLLGLQAMGLEVSSDEFYVEIMKKARHGPGFLVPAQLPGKAPHYRFRGKAMADHAFVRHVLFQQLKGFFTC